MHRLSVSLLAMVIAALGAACAAAPSPGAEAPAPSAPQAEAADSAKSTRGIIMDDATSQCAWPEGRSQPPPACPEGCAWNEQKNACEPGSAM